MFIEYQLQHLPGATSEKLMKELDSYLVHVPRKASGTAIHIQQGTYSRLVRMAKHRIQKQKGAPRFPAITIKYKGFVIAAED